MPVVRIPTPLRPHTGGHDSVEASRRDRRRGPRPGRHPVPPARERIFDVEGLRRFVNVYVNNEDIRYLDDLTTAVADKDEVSIIPAVAGG